MLVSNMPRSRSTNKKQITKTILKESVRQPKNLMKTRLMVISLKADDYIYKQKPISIQEADTYAREMETYRNQCQDERYLQVIEKLTGYMKCIIREQAPKDIINAKIMNPIGNLIEDAAMPEYNAIIDLEMERSLSNLSIATNSKDPLLADIDNTDIHQEKAKIEHSNFAVSKGTFKKFENHKVAYTNKVTDTSNPTPVDKKQKEFVDDSNVESQNILSNFEFENYTSLSSLRNYRNSKNEQIQETKQIAVSENRNTGNYTNKSENSNLNNKNQKEIEIVGDNSNLSQNIVTDFEYTNYSGEVVSQSHINPRNDQTLQGNKKTSNVGNTINLATKYSRMDTGNGCTNLEEVINLKTTKRKELGSESTKQSQRMSSIGNSNYATRFLQNANKRPNDIVDANNKATNSSNMNAGNFYTKPKMSNLYNIHQKEKESGGDSNVSQNILANFGNEKDAAVSIVRNNTSSKKYQTLQINDTRHPGNDNKLSKSNLVQHKTYKSSTFNDIQDSTIFKTNTQNNLEPLKRMQHDITSNPSQKKINKIKTVEKRKKPAKKDIVKTEKKRTYKRKPKVNDVITACNDLSKERVVSANQDAKHPENSVNNSKERKNQDTFLRKKIQEMDISWVENIKFVRAIQTDEYLKFESLEESFWIDLSLPSNMSLTDFEYDQINIWKN